MCHTSESGERLPTRELQRLSPCLGFHVDTGLESEASGSQDNPGRLPVAVSLSSIVVGLYCPAAALIAALLHCQAEEAAALESCGWELLICFMRPPQSPGLGTPVETTCALALLRSQQAVLGLWPMEVFSLYRSDPKSTFHFQPIPLTFSSLRTDFSVSDRIHSFGLLSLYIAVPCSTHHISVLLHNTASCLKLRIATGCYLQHLLKCRSLAVLPSVLLPNGQHYLDVTWKLSLRG